MEEIKMEGIKNEGVKNEIKSECKCEDGKKCTCGCGGSCGCGCKCCSKSLCAGCGRKWIKGLIVLVLALLIFSLGLCVGRHESRFSHRAFNRTAKSGQSGTGGCPMMQSGSGGSLMMPGQFNGNLR